MYRFDKLVSFVIPQAPHGKERTRSVGTKHYTPDKTRKYESLVGQKCRAAMIFTETRRAEGPTPIRLEMTNYHPIPKSWPQKDKERARKGLLLPTSQRLPDCSNVLKAIEDGLNGIGYDDDAQIVQVSVCDFYGDRPRTEVSLFRVFLSSDYENDA